MQDRCGACIGCVCYRISFEEGDRAALQAFKSMICHGPQGIGNAWNDTSHFTELKGITWGRRHRSHNPRLDVKSMILICVNFESLIH
ncbi:hypothetical protein CICLE_v10013574mg [Citrus x clementina]|uniref:Uncharacterized protein n=1 Tax=Citrus clementina TaxID=85681 RepID=V4SLH3_CITCL|nr:hypothetical protein CICLE_v10013574mg [Citrus x clementina]